MKILLEEAVKLLKSDNVVALPTETVYGLGARFDSKIAIQRIFEIKKRPFNHPLIIHISEIEWLYDLAKDIKPYIDPLIKAFWPGPLTVVLRKKSVIHDMITASQDTVAIRMPDHPLFLDVIKKVGVPIVAPSANTFCKTSPTTADHVEKNFQSTIPVLDGGKCKIGIESTIILATEDCSLTLLRPGILSKKEIEAVSKIKFLTMNSSVVKAPGQKKVHYQPGIPVVAFENNNERIRKYISEKEEKYLVMQLNKKVFYHSFHEIIHMPKSPIHYSQLLYEKWNDISFEKFDKILIELPPDQDQWQGIRDRILKAACEML